MTATITVRVSGKTWSACCDPAASAVPAEIGLTRVACDWSKVGRGYRVVWPEMPVTVARDLLDHLKCVGSGFADGDDPDTRSEGRAILKDAHRLAEELTSP